MECRVLGTLELLGPRGWETPAASKRRRTIAALILHAGNALTSERIADAVWGESVPASATKVIQNHVLQLRKDFGPDSVTTRGHAYLVDSAHLSSDASRFDADALDARRSLESGDVEDAATRLERAVTAWRGTAYPDLAGWSGATAEIARLDELRALVVEDLFEARIALGDHLRVVGDLEAAVADAPLRERRWRLLMLALFRSDRQADALAAYQRARALLASELGVEPGSALRAMERAVLDHDATLDRAEVARFDRWKPMRVIGPDDADADFATVVARHRAELAQLASSGDLRREAVVLVELASAERLAGDDAYRATARRAAARASEIGDADLLVRAALAGTRRAGAQSATEVDDELVDLLEAAMPSDRLTLADRARVESALAQELTASTDSARRRVVCDAALTNARKSQDPAVLTEVLSRRAVTLVGPNSLADRLATTAENVIVAAQIDDLLTRWAAIRTRLHVTIEAGDRNEAEQRLGQLRAITNRLGAPAADFGLAIDEAWHALLLGQLEDAEAHAAKAYALGASQSRPEAFGLYMGQLIEIRRSQGRLEELIGFLDPAAVRRSDRSSSMALIARSMCELGRFDEAGALLERGLPALDQVVPHHWLTAAYLWSEVAAATGHLGAADILLPRLTPYETHVCFNACWAVGSVAEALALLAVTTGRDAAARTWFAQADTAYRELGAPLLRARNLAARDRISGATVRPVTSG